MNRRPTKGMQCKTRASYNLQSRSCRLCCRYTADRGRPHCHIAKLSRQAEQSASGGEERRGGGVGGRSLVEGREGVGVVDTGLTSAGQCCNTACPAPHPAARPLTAVGSRFTSLRNCTLTFPRAAAACSVHVTRPPPPAPPPDPDRPGHQQLSHDCGLHACVAAHGAHPGHQLRNQREGLVPAVPG